MFILDKNVTGGAYKSGSNREYITGWSVVNGSSAKWHRMSDGTLVGATNALFARCSYLCNMGTNANGYADYDAANGFNSASYSNVRRCYSDCTVDGGVYRFKLLRLRDDIRATAVPGSEFDKYIRSTGISNWSLTQKLVEGVLGLSNLFPGLDTIGNKVNVSFDGNAAIRVYGTPTGQVPTISPEQTALGTITEPTSVTLQLVGSPAVTASWDGQQAETVQTNVGSVTINLADKWESLSYGSHTILVRSSQGGYQCGATITFSKSSSVVEVVTKPHLTIERPSMVKVVGDLLVPSGAELTVDVSNNAGDEGPQWEPCGEDMTHYFANTTKTADQWGLAVRVSIDNSSGSSNAEIRNSIAAGVMYEREV